MFVYVCQHNITEEIMHIALLVDTAFTVPSVLT